MVSEDLSYTFYALRRGQFMSEASNTTLERTQGESLVWVKEVWPSRPYCFSGYLFFGRSRAVGYRVDTPCACERERHCQIARIISLFSLLYKVGTKKLCFIHQSQTVRRIALLRFHQFLPKSAHHISKILS
jgi:hypothetical protein